MAQIVSQQAYTAENQRQEQVAYENMLAECCHYDGILAVLTQHRPYFEALPSIRRLQESMVIIPLPNVRSREVTERGGTIDTHYRIRSIPCDIALMVCDPEWQIKTGIEIVLFIQRPGEAFSQLLRRWRQTQVELGQGVEWLMPRQHRHLLSEGTEVPHPLFVVFTPNDDRPLEDKLLENKPVEEEPLKSYQVEDDQAAEIDFSVISADAASRVEHHSTSIIHGLTGAGLPVAVQPLPIGLKRE